MGHRDGEVHDELDVVPGQRLLDRAGAFNGVPVGLAARPLGEDVGDEPDIEVRIGHHVREVLVADAACADDGDTHCSRAHVSNL